MLKTISEEMADIDIALDRLEAAVNRLTKRIEKLEELENVRKINESTKRTKSAKKPTK